MNETRVEEAVDKVLRINTKEGLQLELGRAFDKIEALLRKYLDINEDYYKILPLWILGTYMHNSFNAYPFLYLNAQRGSGKTRLLKIIAQLSYKGYGQVQTGITESVLFRSDKGATLVLDECESIASKEKATLREYLNASYKKGATVKRNKKVKSKEEEGYQLETFQPYRPVALANIYGMNDVLGDRCLTMILEKSNNSAVTKLLEDFDSNQEFLQLTRTLYDLSVVMCSVVTPGEYISTWNTYIISKYNYTTIHNPLETLEYTKLHELFNKIDAAEINGRNLELIFPLLIIADFLGESIRDTTLEVIKRLIDTKREEEFAEDKDVSLIDYIASREVSRFTWVSINELTRQFREFLGEIEDEDRWLNPKWVGKALKRLNLVAKKRRVSRGIEVLLSVDRAKTKKGMYKENDTTDS